MVGTVAPGLRLVNKMTKMVIDKSNGQKITTWPIKYPHVKKNAQQIFAHTYHLPNAVNTACSR